jgi:hypothetical protein
MLGEIENVFAFWKWDYGHWVANIDIDFGRARRFINMDFQVVFKPQYPRDTKSN